MDFPADQPRRPIISTYSYLSVAKARHAMAGNLVGTSVAWPAANRALYIPFALPYPYPLRRLFWCNGSALGNMDIGVYTSRGARLYSTTSTAQSGASVLQFVTVSPEITLHPGHYYLGLLNDGTTNRVTGTITPTVSQGRTVGLLQEDLGSTALPATMTPAALSSFVLPLCGITLAATGF